MIPVLATLASGAMFFLSTGLGSVWPLAWLAAVPILWVVFGELSSRRLVLASFCAFALGELNLFEAYAQMAPMIALLIVLNSSLFAASMLFTRWVSRRLPPVASVFAFPAIWTSIEFLYAQVSPNGSFGSFAYSQVPAPVLIQSASVFGLWSITFLLCLSASAIALVLREGRRARTAGVLAALVFMANLVFGVVRLNAPEGPVQRVASVSDDSLRLARSAQRAATVIAQYTKEANDLAREGATVIVLPEKIAVLDAHWPDETAPLVQAASASGSRIVASFEEHADHAYNTALTFNPDASIDRYIKRHLVPVVEPLVAGQSSSIIHDGQAVAICKDMDFGETIRHDARLGITMMLVPAWDFERDRDLHANMAILRGVENGFALVRSARDGLVTLSDAKGRVVARAESSRQGPVAIIGNLAEGPGDTPYVHLGDIFGWFSGALALALTVGAALAHRPKDVHMKRRGPKVGTAYSEA